MWSRVRECNRSNWNAGKYGSVGECDQGCSCAIEGCQRISGGVSRKLLTNIRSHTIGILDYLMAVLVAVSIPVFTAQLEKSREATDAANIRSAYAEVVTTYLDQASINSISVAVHQRQSGVQTSPAPVLTYQGAGSQVEYPLSSAMSNKTSGSYTVTISIDSSTGAASPIVS